MRQEFNRIS